MSYTARIRDKRWEAIEKKAWELAQQADKFIKPTDVLDAVLDKYIDQIQIKDLEIAKKNRK